MEIVRKGRKGRNRANYGQGKRCTCVKMTPCKPVITSHDCAPIKHRTGKQTKRKVPNTMPDTQAQTRQVLHSDMHDRFLFIFSYGQMNKNQIILINVSLLK